MDDATENLLRASLMELIGARPEDIAVSLSELGWEDALADDAAAAWTLLFESQGRSVAATRALDLVAFHAAGLEPLGEVLWPYPGEKAPVEGGRFRALCLSGAPTVPWLPLPADRWIRVDPGGLEVTPVRGFDTTTGWSVVTGDAVGADAAVGSWTDALAAARRALASELLGVSTRALEVAVEHVSVREQFGRSIGSFQAVRHRLAEAYAWIEGARPLIRHAWSVPTPELSAAAKAVAGRAHADTARQCIQVCGGMGLSAEHPLPAAVSRGYVLDALAGSHREIALGHGSALTAGADLRTWVGAL